MDIDIVLESFPNIVETTKALLEHENKETVLLWATEYYSHKHHTTLNDIIVVIVNHLAETRT